MLFLWLRGTFLATLKSLTASIGYDPVTGHASLRLMGFRELQTIRKRPSCQSATTIQLEPIDPDRYYFFARDQFSKSGKILEREAFDVIYNLFEGITLYVHRVLHDCYYYTDVGENCSKEEAELFCDNYINECGAKIKEILAGISESQKELLYAVSAEKTAAGITSGAFIKRHDLKSASAVQSAAKALIETGILTKKGYAYSLSDPMTRIWLEKR